MEVTRMAGKKANLIQRLTARLRRFVKGRHRVLKRQDRFEARLPFVVTLAGSGRDSGKRAHGRLPALVGFTRNLSETGLTLLLPSVRIGDAYITDAESRLEIKLELIDGPVMIRTAPVRFEQLPRREAGCGYLLAVRIEGFIEGERERYVAYLKGGGTDGRRTPERRRAVAAATNGSNSASQAGKWESLTPASVSKAFEKFVRE
jgi:hypothetical protein